MNTSHTLDRVNDCWNQIGVGGDRSCVKLETEIHCRNCPVYSAAGRGLLERDIPLDYLNEWTTVLAQTQESSLSLHDSHHNPTAPPSQGIEQTVENLSIIIFRLGDERLALPVRLLQEVTHLCAIHTLPHRSNDLFLGLVNIRGEILLCASLSHLLSLETPTNTPSSHSLKRMLVVGQKDSKWVFCVDEVDGIYRFHRNALTDAPVVVAKANETYTKGIVEWRNKKVNYLDAELLFYTLNRKVL